MSEEEKKFIYKIVKKMYGEIEPIGETNEDNLRYYNLTKYEDLINLLVQDIIKVAEYYNSKSYSLYRAGNRAKLYLYDLRDNIQDYLGME